MANFLPGTEITVRGLRWEVVDEHPMGDQTRLRLRGLGGLLAGVEIDVLSPFEPVEVVARELNPQKAGALPIWLVYHQSFLLEQALGPDAILAINPGRLRIEPYQLVPLARALRMNRPRLLIADDVGLGKTVEAGLIAAELMARRQVYRLLVVTPAGPLMEQWKRELSERFGMHLEEINRDRLEQVRKETELGANPFEHLPMAIASMDFLKQDSILDLLERTTYDLIVMDEAHHYSETGIDANNEAERVDSSQRRKLAQTLARQSDALLLLTATPHDGYERSYTSLIELLDPMLLNLTGDVHKDIHVSHVVRRLKRHVQLTDPKTGELVSFPERQVIPVPVVSNPERDSDFITMHRELLQFIVPTLKRALRYRHFDDALAFLALLKRSTSTVAALSTTLAAVQSRFSSLSTTQTEEQESRSQRRKSLRALKRKYARFGVLTQEEEAERDALEIEELAQQLNLLDLEYRRGSAELERTESIATSLARLKQYADRARDVKLEALLTEIAHIRQAEPRANILIYTEYVDSLIAAHSSLKETKAGKILTITGNDGVEHRQQVTQQFRTQDNLILISTDTSAEGLNLHDRCHHLIHLELPWNPNRLEQRNGRIDRYGQWQTPYVRYLYLCSTFEERILARLIAKYERQRDRLRAVPNILGIGAAELPENNLLALLAQDDGSSLGVGQCASFSFADDTVADETDAAEIQALLEEVDKSLRRFEQSSRIHSWIKDGAAADQYARDRAVQALEVGRKASGVDLMTFVKQAVHTEGGQVVEQAGMTRLKLPHAWRYGLEDVPGWDIERGTLVVTSDINQMLDDSDQPVGFLGRAHPVVRRAIDHVRHQSLGQDTGLDRRVSAARSADGHKALIFTFLGRINSRSGREFERVLAVKVSDALTVEVLDEPHDWLPSASDGIATLNLWENQFAQWGDRARDLAQAAAADAFEDIAVDFSANHRRRFEDELLALERWYAERVNALVAPTEPESLPLFEGLKDPQESPFDRLEVFIQRQDPNSKGRLEALALQDFYRRRYDRIQDQLALTNAGTSLLGMLMLA